MVTKQPTFGFTLIELVVALLIGSILTSIALSSFGNASARFAARGARDAFVAMQARGRAQSIEMGQTVRVYLLPSTDRGILLAADGTWLEDVDFRERFDVDIQGINTRLCMNTRGYADEECNSFTTPRAFHFVINADSSSVTMLPLGQLIY